MHAPRQASAPPKTSTASIGALLLTLGVMALCIGAIVFFVTAGHDPNAAPSCDGKAMDPGDRCLAIGHDGGGGYEEMQQAENEENDRYALLAQVLLGSGAVLVFLGGAMQIARAAGRTRRR